MAQASTDRVDERLIAGPAQLLRYERRKSPVLPFGVELVRRGAHADALRQDVLERPRVRAVGVEPDGQVLHHRHHAGGACKLKIDLQLQPLVEPDSIRGRALAYCVTNGRRGGVPQLLGPAVPPGLEAFGERTERRELTKPLSLLRDERVQRRQLPPADNVPDALECANLEPVDLVAIDPAMGVQRPRARRNRREIPERRRAVHLLDPQIERAPKSAARGEVGAGLLRYQG
jgi:hypothetical protein